MASSLYTSRAMICLFRSFSQGQQKDGVKHICLMWSDMCWHWDTLRSDTELRSDWYIFCLCLHHIPWLFSESSHPHTVSLPHSACAGYDALASLNLCQRWAYPLTVPPSFWVAPKTTGVDTYNIIKSNIKFIFSTPRARSIRETTL